VQQIQVEGYQQYNACMHAPWHFGGKHKQHGRRQDSRIPIKKKFNKSPQNKPMQNMC
jgi:hypothetical protein